MEKNVRDKDLQLFMDMSGEARPKEFRRRVDVGLGARLDDLGTQAHLRDRLPAVSAVLIIDLVVASVLMSMGMMMPPPVVVSLRFKLIFFVLVDAGRWSPGSLIQSHGT